MIKVSFEKFESILSKGFLSEDDFFTHDEMYLEPVNNVDIPFFLTDFKLKSYSGAIFPVELNHLKPFIKFQKTKSQKTVHEIKFNEIGLDTDKWDNLWKHLLYYYLFLAVGKRKNPWGIIDSTEDDLYDKNIDSYYRYLKIIEDSDNLLYELIFEKHLPEEFVQMAFLKKSVANHLSKYIDNVKNNSRSQYPSFLKSKGVKWAEHLENHNVEDLWINILKQSNNKNKTITKETVSLICFLFSIEAYLSRIDLTTSLNKLQHILNITIENGPVPQKDLFFELTLIHYFSKLFNSRDYLKEIIFLPDYFLLNYLTRDFYNYHFQAHKTPLEKSNTSIYKRFKNNKNLINPEYLLISGTPEKKGGIRININTKYLNKLNFLPIYIYKDVLKDLLKTSIEIYGFTKNKLGILPESLFKEFEQFKTNQQYDLTKKVDYDKWLEDKVKLLVDISHSHANT
ncbi:MAG: hypothetical protein H8D45_07775 [Bacteroidetes bacterium]|nr:hypothetical protein [Bacteroidota bacterium]